MRSLKKTEDQIAVIAGDLSTTSYLAVALKLLCEQFAYVVYTPGNHEYYGTSWHGVDDKAEMYMEKLPNLFWLENTSCTIEDKSFHGATLWFPQAEHLGFHKYSLNDFNQIKGFEPEVYTRYERSREFLRQNVKQGDVVITHHTPSYQSIHPKYERNLLNCFFATNSDSIVIDTKPSLWVHGHTHSSFDYRLGDTRVICNPFGYASYEENPDFQENLIVEI